MALLGHGHPDPGSLELRHPRAPQEQFFTQLPFQASAQPQAAPAPPEDPRQCHGLAELPACGRDTGPAWCQEGFLPNQEVSWQPCSTEGKARGSRALLES